MSGRLLDEAAERARAQIGNRFVPTGKEVHEVTERLVREWAYGLEEWDPTYSDPASAAGAGLVGLRVPPSLLYLVARGPSYEMYPFPTDIVSLHGESEWEFYRDLRVGDRISAVAWITGVEKKFGERYGPLVIVRTTNEYRDDQERLVGVHRHVTVLYSIEESMKRQGRSDPTAAQA